MWTEIFAAGEYICCGVPILRPRMDANVGFSYGDNASDSLGREFVKGFSDDCGTCCFGSVQKRLLDVVHIIQQIWPTLLQLQDQV